MWFVDNGSQMLDLVQAVINSVTAIAGGAVGQAAQYVEESLAKAIPVTIGFLASLLGLGDLSSKIKGIIEQAQEPIGRAIDWVIGKAQDFAKKMKSKLGHGKDEEKGALGLGEDKEGEDKDKDKEGEGEETADPATVKAGLAAIDAEAMKYLNEDGEIQQEEARQVATTVKGQHPVFQSITVVDGDDSWDYDYSVQRYEEAIAGREASAAGGEASTDLESTINRARGGGQRLDAGLQQSMGQAMGADFSGVRVHIDTQSDQLNQSIQATAFTTGQDIFFGRGAYQPGSREGQELIAHELAHVVQQNGAAVRGSNGEQGSDTVVQAKAGDLSTGVLPRFRSQPTERQVVFDVLPQVAERDADHNNKAKVALENKLANWVVTNSDEFIDPVKQLSASINEYLIQREKHIKTDLATSLATLTPDASTYGKMVGDLAYPKQLQALLAGNGSLHEHLLVHQMFIDRIYNNDADQIIKELHDKFEDLIGEGMEKDQLKPKEGAVDIGVGSMTYKAGHDDARKERKRKEIPKVKIGGLGPYNKETHLTGEKIRGTDRFMAVENNAFTQAARLILDMPVSGTGLSGSATDMFACAKLFKLEKGANPDYALAAFSFFAQAGAHTFNEVMLMAKATGFNEYVPGNYISAIPESRRAKVREDLGADNALLAEPAQKVAPIHSADKTLHGWKDVLTLDGNVSGWAAKVKTFIASRFGVSAEAVTVTPITDGRSGDMVYKVDVVQAAGAPFKGIFKVFRDADLADAEIKIGETMRDKGVQTPGNRGMARIETKDGSPSQAGVLFERAEGESVHALVKQIGVLAKDAEERAALVTQLERAVVAVAKQLAILHGKVGTTELRRNDQMAPQVKTRHEKGLYKAHLKAASEKLKEDEIEHIKLAFEDLLETSLVQQTLRKSMTHGDANAGNFIVNGDQASIIDVNTGMLSLGRTGKPMKTGAADTGRFLESLRTAHPGALTKEELNQLHEMFHKAYMPGSESFNGKLTKKKENELIKIDKEKAADKNAEVYYRACWILNQLSHAKETARKRTLKLRLIELMPDKLTNKLEIGD